MNSTQLAMDQLKAYIEVWLSSHLNNSGKKREEVIAQLTPIISTLLKSYGFKILTDQDFVFIKKALDDVKMDKNMKKVLVEYNTSIIEIMENKK